MWLFVPCWSVEAHKRLHLIVEAVVPDVTSGTWVVQANIWVDVGWHQVTMVAGSQVILVVKMTHEGSPISIPVTLENHGQVRTLREVRTRGERYVPVASYPQPGDFRESRWEIRQG